MIAVPSGYHRARERERFYSMEGMPVSATAQKEKAARFRRMHHEAPLLVLPNIWDAVSARVVEQAGFPAVATTSSGVAAALGYGDGEQISWDILIDALARITRVVECPARSDSGTYAIHETALSMRPLHYYAVGTRPTCSSNVPVRSDCAWKHGCTTARSRPAW